MYQQIFKLVILPLVCFGLSPIAQATDADGDLAKGNTNEGGDALASLTTGIHNTALGFQAQFSNSTGNYNTATGSQALKNNTGNFNTADGFQALVKNTIGADNAATGYRALFQNTMGSDNTATGLNALYSNTTGGGNAAYGVGALFANTTGNNNVAIGPDALENTTGLDNIGLGVSAGVNLTTGFRNIDIGNEGVAGESSTIRIGDANQFRTFIAGIAGVDESGPISVVTINSDGQLGTAVPVSSRRFKKDIKPMDKASEAILALKPVTFRYKEERDPKGIPQFGLVAEEVEKVNPDLITSDREGKPYTVRYDAVNAMLLNEFLKEHQKVQKLEAALAAVNERLKAQDAKIDKVNAKVELTKPAPQTVLNQ